MKITLNIILTSEFGISSTVRIKIVKIFENWSDITIMDVSGTSIWKLCAGCI